MIFYFTFSELCPEIWEQVGDQAHHDGRDAQADGVLVVAGRHGAEEDSVKSHGAPEPGPKLPVHVP